MYVSMCAGNVQDCGRALQRCFSEGLRLTPHASLPCCDVPVKAGIHIELVSMRRTLRQYTCTSMRQAWRMRTDLLCMTVGSCKRLCCDPLKSTTQSTCSCDTMPPLFRVCMSLLGVLSYHFARHVLHSRSCHVAYHHLVHSAFTDLVWHKCIMGRCTAVLC